MMGNLICILQWMEIKKKLIKIIIFDSLWKIKK